MSAVGLSGRGRTSAITHSKSMKAGHFYTPAFKTAEQFYTRRAIKLDCGIRYN